MKNDTNTTPETSAKSDAVKRRMQRLVLCDYRTHKGRIIKRWLKPETVVEAKHSCGCEEYMYARDVGKHTCMLCMPENAQNPDAP